MVIQRNDRPVHWDYVLAMEEDLQRLSRFVDFTGNDDTYSIEIARILMAAAAETDVVLRALCRSLDPTSRRRSIGGYFPIVCKGYPGLNNIQVTIDRYGLTLRPWSSWTETTPPRWWTANNKVKHERASHFGAASLKNCLNAVGGLFAAVLYLYGDRAKAGELLPTPTLLRVPGSMSNAMDSHPTRLFFRLP